MSRKERNRDHRNAGRGVTGFIDDWRAQLLSRRSLLLRGIAIGASLYAANLFAGETQTQNVKAGKDEVVGPTVVGDWSEHELKTLAAVQNRLFPRQQDSPGADDINALAYLQRALEDPSLAEDKQFIRNGVGWLDDLSATTYQKTFLQLDDDKREALLRTIAKSSAGENWLSTLLLYIFEALLTDPVYGGNPDGIGWAWLEHTPGFPHPPADKTYRKLASR
jgi:gluconate 2-dehydrogenase gamma chain